MNFLPGESTYYAHLAWVPPEDQEFHHQLLFKCPTCHSTTRACQFYGHLSQVHDCTWPKRNTVYDKPVCNKCSNLDKDLYEQNQTDLTFLYPSHNLYQSFVDRNMNLVFIFFDGPDLVDLFFGEFTAEKCFSSRSTGVNFLSTAQWHLRRFRNQVPLYFPLSFESRAQGKDHFRYYYLSGNLKPLCVDKK